MAEPETGSLCLARVEGQCGSEQREIKRDYLAAKQATSPEESEMNLQQKFHVNLSD